jgi:TMEM175 potassium channel family protein
VTKGRFEAFSDGVFAIAITLLILEIHLPDAETLNDGQMQHYLIHLWPQLVTYVTSFATIGIIWLNHHSTFVHVQSLDHVTLSLNLVLLLTVCFVPFPTALVAKYGALPSSTALYGATLTAMGLSYGALWYYTVRQEYRRSPSTAPRLKGITMLKGMAGTGAYFIGTLIAFIAPHLSAFLFVSVAIYYAIPGRLETARRGTTSST